MLRAAIARHRPRSAAASGRGRLCQPSALRAASSLRVDSVPAIEGREVVLRDALIMPGTDAPLRFAAGIDLPALARLARTGGDVPARMAAYHAEVGPVPLSGLLTGLSLLVARHLGDLTGFIFQADYLPEVDRTP